MIEKRHKFNQMQNNYEQASFATGPTPTKMLSARHMTPLPAGGEEVLLCGFSSLGGRPTLCA